MLEWLGKLTFVDPGRFLTELEMAALPTGGDVLALAAEVSMVIAAEAEPVFEVSALLLVSDSRRSIPFNAATPSFFFGDSGAATVDE